MPAAVPRDAEPATLPTARERKDLITRMIQEDAFVEIIPYAIVRNNGAVNVGRYFRGHKSIVIIVKDSLSSGDGAAKERLGGNVGERPR